MNGDAAPSPRRQAWYWLGRTLGALLVLALVVVLVRQAGRIDWRAVGLALAEMPAHLLLAAAGMALASHLLYACFDLLGRRYTGHHLPSGQVLLVGTTSYAFNLSLGAVLGGLACRARLYTRLGLPGGRIARIVTFSLVSNWLGYLMLAGMVFALAPPELPPSWGVAELAGGGMRWLGGALLALGLLYLALCARHGGHALGWRHQAWPVPHLPLALAQMGVSVAHWGAMAAVLFLLLQGRVPYVQVVAVLMVAAVAGVITHVPAGLGVLEAVFVALLSHRLPAATVLAGLVCYRLLFYLLPLGLGAAVFLRLEAHAAS
jgi:uncharacterized membrane protein YbhN (UPF0104 family)